MGEATHATAAVRITSFVVLLIWLPSFALPPNRSRRECPPPLAQLRRSPDPVEIPKGVFAPSGLIAEEEYWSVVQPEARVDPEERVRGIEQNREQLEASLGADEVQEALANLSAPAY